MFNWLFGDKASAAAPAAATNGSSHATSSQPVPKVLDLTPATVVDAALDQMSTTADPRLKEIMEAAVRHLHAFAREVDLKPGEWLTGIDFMTRVGKMCTPERQEFILLSDTVGLSALVNLMHDKTALEIATDTSLLGPFFRENAPRFKPGDQIAKDTRAGELVIHGRVLDVAGRPIANAEVGLWQTASDGLYDIQSNPAGDMDSRGIFSTDADGKYLLRTVAPIDYSIPLDGPVGELIRAQKRHGMRPAHMHFLISAPGYRELVTALYLSTSNYLATDTVFGSSSVNLVAQINPSDPACPIKGIPAIRYDFKLSRMSEIDMKTGRVGSDPGKILAH